MTSGHRWTTVEDADAFLWACRCGEQSKQVFPTAGEAVDAAEAHAREANAPRTA